VSRPLGKLIRRSNVTKCVWLADPSGKQSIVAKLIRLLKSMIVSCLFKGFVAACRSMFPHRSDVRISLTVAVALYGPICLPALAQTAGDGSETAPFEFSEAGTLTQAKPLVITQGQPIFLQLERNGGTGYYWNPAIENDKVVKVDFVKSIEIKKTFEENVVGRPEVDVFRITGERSGSTLVSFNLIRSRSNPITSVRLSFRVRGAG
jgi:predicted secreted protein